MLCVVCKNDYLPLLSVGVISLDLTLNIKLTLLQDLEGLYMYIMSHEKKMLSLEQILMANPCTLHNFHTLCGKNIW